MDSRVESLLLELNRLEKWHLQEYNLCRQSNWNSFSSAKGQYRWMRKYMDHLRSKCCAYHDDPDQFFSAALSLLDDTSWDSDYPEPARAKESAKEIIKRYHV